MSGDDLNWNYHYFPPADPMSNQPVFGLHERADIWLDEVNIPVLKEKIITCRTVLEFGKRLRSKKFS